VKHGDITSAGNAAEQSVSHLLDSWKIRIVLSLSVMRFVWELTGVALSAFFFFVGRTTLNKCLCIKNSFQFVLLGVIGYKQTACPRFCVKQSLMVQGL